MRLVDLARECGLSASQFSRAFRRTVRETPHQWLIRQRIERAKVLLNAAFERDVAANQHIVTAERLFGEPDFTLRVLARDLAGYQNIYDNELGALPGVQRLTSTLVMKRIGVDRSVPILWVPPSDLLRRHFPGTVVIGLARLGSEGSVDRSTHPTPGGPIPE
ncbi:Lrp/AsnC ligand binding domain-containing protein [Mycolicibacterium sarraceniae]|uniref:HTH araC/xylS-type domain-containing protein n=1 Tax=Mycolicibacterium sarraceniae TaxID=1534348 RepID=A0A7I7SV99_9MYCO|nr:Lrp/AsnC ligand binding domain-containing protein [Mycolicibacterium sarraceniae]BBY60944.1 hypothetical protein MSAR_40800 [Mycolicibacterium sarraceniae]